MCTVQFLFLWSDARFLLITIVVNQEETSGSKQVTPARGTRHESHTQSQTSA